MWTEEYQAEFIRGYLEIAAQKDFVAGMQVWNFADFAAVQSIVRVGGMNMKGVFTRARYPKMAAHVLREFWVTKSEASQIENESKIVSVSPVTNALSAENEIESLLEGLVQQADEKLPDVTTTLKFDLYEKGIYRLIIEKGVCRVESGDGEATASMKLNWKNAQKLFAGKLNPMVAIMTGKIKTEGDARAFMVLQNLM
jgi:putative sterol carrier protein